MWSTRLAKSLVCRAVVATERVSSFSVIGQVAATRSLARDFVRWQTASVNSPNVIKALDSEPLPSKSPVRTRFEIHDFTYAIIVAALSTRYWVSLLIGDPVHAIDRLVVHGRCSNRTVLPSERHERCFSLNDHASLTEPRAAGPVSPTPRGRSAYSARTAPMTAFTCGHRTVTAEDRHCHWRRCAVGYTYPLVS